MIVREYRCKLGKVLGKEQLVFLTKENSLRRIGYDGICGKGMS